MSDASSSARQAARLGLAIAMAGYFLSLFHRVAPAAISGDLQATFAIGGAQLGTLAATYFYVYTLMQLPTGVLADTLGPRQILFWGGLMAGLGAILFGMAATFEIAFLGRTLVGLGVSVTFIAMLKLIALGFDERRFASITGLLLFLGNAGSILAGMPLAWVTQITGWRPIFIAVGVLSLLMAFASRAWIRETPTGKIDRSQWLAGLILVLKNRATWPGFFANVGLSGAFYAFAGLWAQPYLMQMQNMSRATASNHLSIYFAGFALGAAIWGHISDRIGRRKIAMMFVSGIHALGWWVWLQSGVLPAAATYALCAIMGAAAAGFTLSWASAKEVNPPQLSGMATAVVNVGVFLGPAILQPLTGWLMERSWDGRIENGIRIYSATDWHRGLLLIAAAAAAGWFATLFVTETRCRNVWREAQ